MEQQGRSTFIPQGASVAPRPKRRRVGVFTVLSILIFAFSVLGFGGAVYYEQILDRQIAELDELIRNAEDAFDRPLLEEIARVDRKIKAAREILANHRSLAALFDLINNNTLHNVRFTAFGFDVSQEGEYILSLQGIGRDYTAIALQSDAFVQTRRLKNVVFNNLRLNNDGTVSYLMTATIDPDLLAYELTI